MALLNSFRVIHVNGAEFPLLAPYATEILLACKSLEIREDFRSGWHVYVGISCVTVNFWNMSRSNRAISSSCLTFLEAWCLCGLENFLLIRVERMLWEVELTQPFVLGEILSWGLGSGTQGRHCHCSHQLSSCLLASLLTWITLSVLFH